MSRSPEFIRLAASAAKTVADTAFMACMRLSWSWTRASKLCRSCLPMRRRGRVWPNPRPTFRAEVWPEIALSEASSSHLYRIAQEALTKAARHGHATLVEIFSWWREIISRSGSRIMAPAWT
jgi:hypothetical protein